MSQSPGQNNPQDPYQQYGHGQPYPPHGQPPYPPGPYGYQPQPPRKPGKSPIFWIFAVGLPLVLLVGCVAAVVSVVGNTSNSTGRPPVADRTSSSDSQSRPSASGNAQPSERAEQAAGIGAVVNDGQFAFKVTKLEKASRVGTDLLHKDAQGEFLVVHVTVKNTGDKPGHFFGDAQKVYDADGREYSADSAAAIYFQDAKSLYEEINPGNQVNGVVLFDLPKGVEATSIVLHDSLFSGGVKVSLGSA